ncbi:malonate-ligase [Micractinium conductrix]|uniref:Malonate-ligase n=1 Tax=Micractinium conductrix TaxID=554055 RepID=A0A2P6V497_9CHLO|nr:malonate-ligase [Micractinium conductrix]|eukprot:PSC68906.1 malonate-ligase [Micractinium conductrix]
MAASLQPTRAASLPGACPPRHLTRAALGRPGTRRPRSALPPRADGSAAAPAGAAAAAPVPAVLRPRKNDITDANFPVDAEGRTYHLGTRRGEVANRILSVGSEKRALMLAEYLQPVAPGRGLFMLESSRGFLTITGRYLDIPVSIIVTHMGLANADFVVRENRAVVDGEMAFIRLGTCGALQPPARLGSFIVAEPGAFLIRRNPDAFSPEGEALGLPPYTFSRPIPSDPVLSLALQLEAARLLGPEGVCSGLNATADSFYSSQGRRSAWFDDRNDTLLADLLAHHPTTVTLEMETAQLFDLARCSRGTMRVAAGVIALADRQSNDFLSGDRIEKLERLAGQACLAALAKTVLDDAWGPHNGCGTPLWALRCLLLGMSAAAAAALKAKGNAEFSKGELAAAVSSWTEALSLLDRQPNPQGLHLLYGNRAAAALKLGDFTAALRDAEAALAVEPAWAKALYRKAAALQGLGRRRDAAAAALAAAAAEPSNREVQALLRQLGSDAAAAAPAMSETTAGDGAADDSAAQQHHQQQRRRRQETPSGPGKPPPTAAMLPALLKSGPWEYMPAADGTNENLLLLFHGLGDRPAAFAALARRMALPQTAALALGGPQEVPFSEGGRSWHTAFTDDFELIQGRPGEQRRTRSLREVVAALQQLLAALHDRCGYPPRCVHLLGFSQGGTVALELARQQQAAGQPLGSCVAVSAALLPEQLHDLQQQQEAQQQQAQQQADGGSMSTAVLITRGTADKVISQALVEQTAGVLRRMHSMAVELHSVPGKAHAMPQGKAEVRQLMQFWAKRLSRRPTAADLAAAAGGGPGELLEIRPGEVTIEQRHHGARAAMEVLRPALGFSQRVAVVAGYRSHRYADILAAALQSCLNLEGSTTNGSARAAAAAAAAPADVRPAAYDGPRVALMAEPGADWVAGAYATWLHRGIWVPLCLTHPDRELQYVLEDAEVAAVLASERHAERMYQLAKPFGADVQLVEEPAAARKGQQLPDQAAPDRAAVEQQVVEQALQQEVEGRLAGVGPQDGALIIYTSGTTGRPKGALHTHGSLAAQVEVLLRAWGWQADDRLLHALPLHHVHGIVNALLCPLRIGACVEMLPKFSPREVWQRLQRPKDSITAFMGVPTMYSHLLTWHDDHMTSEEQAAAAQAARRLRLTVSGSAACPEPIMQRWERLSGAKLLERYGMTETGMLLGNPYRGERRPGTVGQPFEGVDVRVTDADGGDAGAGPGELRVRSPQLFREYWRRPEATAEAFDSLGYFLTGDTAVLEEGGYYRLLGRTSVDVIKHGGFKISALHIESVLLEHPALAEVAVLGLPDPVYGERIAAVAALKPSAREAGLTLGALRGWAAARLPPYQLPAALQLVPAIPRNAMGKVNKKSLRAELFPEAAAPPASAAGAGA